ncbi:hypothetical protein [Caballeronia sp. RCC_10]|uniref:hypothetical protein n=1 Tax=Caballeronia sp. RCC_10 TaxID=3239227 RepID=UPI0035267DA1
MTLNRTEPRFGFLYTLTIGACLVMVGLFAGLIPTGHWQDEFFTFAAFRKGGLHFYIERLVTWSPRPVSEFLIYVYSRVVEKSNRPLITPVLALLWLTLLAGTFYPVVRSGSIGKPAQRVMLAIAMGTLTLFLLGHPVSEVFYWPQGSMAYLPTLAVFALLFGLFLVGVDTPPQRALCAAALVLAATSSELGAMFVAAFAGMHFILRLVGVGLQPGSMIHRLLTRAMIPWFMPLVVAAAVFVLMKSGRLNSAAEVFGDPAIAHHIGIGLMHAVPQYLIEIIALDGQTLNSRNIWLGAVAKACYFAAVYVGVKSVRGSLKPTGAVQLLIFLIAIAAAAFMSLFGAFYQFGVVCCERHDTMRQCMSILLLGSVAALFARAGRARPAQEFEEENRGLTSQWFSALILCAVLVSSLTSAKLLANDYRRYGQFLASRSQTWASGLASAPAMVVTQVTPGLVIGGVVRPAGDYVRTDETPWFLAGILDFFNKKSMTLTNP